MRIVRYVPDMYPLLSRVALPRSGLLHQPFVDYYYTTRENSWLQLVLDQDGAAIGCIGIEIIPFEYCGRAQSIAFATNLMATHSGVGGLLYLAWIKSAPISMVFGGSADTHQILRAQKWIYYPGVQSYYANRRYPQHEDDPLLRKFAKRALNLMRPRIAIDARSRKVLSASIEVEELQSYDEISTTFRSPFMFRLAPDPAYLRWRYALDLPFASYRLFDIKDDGGSIGFVILHDRAHQIVVSHADGADAKALASGIVKAVLLVSKTDQRVREVLLTSSHPEMQRVFVECGFTAASPARPLVMHGSKGSEPFLQDTSEWLVNFDMGDNSMRPPFGR